MTEFSIKDLAPFILQLWRNKWIILFVTLSGLLAGMAFTVNHEEEVHYNATASACVTYTTYQEQMRGSSVMTSYSGLVASRLVCERAAELLGEADIIYSDIQRMVKNEVANNSYVMYISATAEEPQLAIRLANAVAQAFTEKVTSVSGNNSIQILDVAQTATKITGTRNTAILLLAVAAPFLLVCAWIVLKEMMGDKVRLLSQCAEDPEELLGILPEIK